MATYADLVLANGLATPVNVTFGQMRPYQSEANGAMWLDRSSSTALGFRRVEMGMRRANGSPSYKLPLKVVTPVTAVVNGVTTVSHTLIFDGTFTIPDSASADDRANLLAFVKNALAAPQIAEFVTKLTPAA